MSPHDMAVTEGSLGEKYRIVKDLIEAKKVAEDKAGDSHFDAFCYYFYLFQFFFLYVFFFFLFLQYIVIALLLFLC